MKTNWNPWCHVVRRGRWLDIYSAHNNGVAQARRDGWTVEGTFETYQKANNALAKIAVKNKWKPIDQHPDYGHH